MNNDKGTILTVTLGFILIFSLLGFATLRHAMVQSEMTENRAASVKAFWIADAAVELARSKLAKAFPELIPEGDPLTDAVSFGGGSYYVYSKSDPDCPACIDRWHIRSQGKVHQHHIDDGADFNQLRGIDALVAAYDISNALRTHGTVNGNCDGTGYEACTSFMFETVFNGMRYTDMDLDPTNDFYSIADSNGQEFDLNSITDPFTIEDVTVLRLIGNTPGLNVYVNDLSGTKGGTYDGSAALLIIDTDNYGGGTVPALDIAGTIPFGGIIWVIGEMTISSDPDINGAVFIDGNPPANFEASGIGINFNPGNVDNAIGTFGGTGTPGLIAWKENLL